jgi:hypothetical protein
MSMLLFALSLKPLLILLDQKITVTRICRRTRTAVVAYAGDITLFVTSPADIPGLHEAIQTYERATGANLNIRKSKALAAGSWDAAIDMMCISYRTDINILGVRFTSSIAQSVNTSWTRVTGQVRALAKDVYGRDLCLTQRIQYVHTYLLAKIWHI